MDLFEYSYLTSFQITKKNHDEISILLRDDTKYPTIEKGPHGYIICLAKPERRDNGLTEYLGLTFDLNNEAHRRLLWQTFKASVFHLSMHAAMSSFETYIHWRENKNAELATFVASMIEDVGVKACLKTLWSPFTNDVAVANTLSYLKMKPVQLISNPTLGLMAAVISYFAVRAIKGNPSQSLRNDAISISTALDRIEEVMQKQLLQTTNAREATPISQTLNNLAFDEKIPLANQIYQVLQRYGRTSEAPSLLYTESYGCDSIFQGHNVPTQSDIESNVQNALNTLKVVITEDKGQMKLTEESLDAEISQVFSSWEARDTAEKKILQNYQELGRGSRFNSFEFPSENFSDYLNTKLILASPIRRVLEKMRLYRNQAGDDFRQDVGLLDMQEAIQVIASKSRRTDVFVRDELQSREDSWAILIDASNSLKFFTGEVRGITLCLSEVARELFANQNAWAEFAFNDKFYIVKDFSENYTNRIRGRVGGIEHGGMSFIPDAALLAADALKRRTEEMKLLVVVSDFFPSGYTDAEDRLTECIKKIEKSGMGVIGIGVKSRAVKHYFKIGCVVDNPYDLMKKFVQAFFEFSSTA